MRALSRRDPIDPLWRDLTPQIVCAGVEDEAALARLCAGADLVIHAAGLVKARTRTQFDAVNVEGARRVALAAQAAGTPHVILVSSLTAREPQLSHYSASKRAGEEAMRVVLGPRLTVARPCAIYGPGDRELLPVFQAADSLPLLPILSSEGKIAMIHVVDAARQIAALAAPRAAAQAPAGRVVALSDARPDGYSWRELMAEAAHACGRAPRFVAVPRALIQAVGITNDFTVLLGQTPMLSSAKARELLHPNWAILTSERPDEPPPVLYDLRTGFSATVAWYRSAAWMKH